MIGRSGNPVFRKDHASLSSGRCRRRMSADHAVRYWISGSRINDFFWFAGAGGAGLAAASAVAGAPDASAEEAAGGGTAALGGGSSGPMRPQADRPSATAATSTTSANGTLTRSKAKGRSTQVAETHQHSRSDRSGEILAITPCQRVYLVSAPFRLPPSAVSASVWPGRARFWVRCHRRRRGFSPTDQPKARRRLRR
jgi:hypothetical protein